MTNGISTILAVTLAGTLVTSQLKLFNSVEAQVDGIKNVWETALDAADSISPGTRLLAK